MRMLVAVLAVLAIGKIWVNDRLYRAATREAVIAAYRDRAVEACGREGRKAGMSAGTAALWTPARMDIGDGVAPVYMWDLQHPLWATRYRNPNIVMTTPGGYRLSCSYDVVAGLGRLKND